MKKTGVIICIGLLVSSCAANPNKVEVMQTSDNYLNCEQLSGQLSSAERSKTDARKEDRFRFRYMMPLTAMISVVNMNLAESRAIKRIEHLNQLAKRKGCSNNGYAGGRISSMPDMASMSHNIDNQYMGGAGGGIIPAQYTNNMNMPQDDMMAQMQNAPYMQDSYPPSMPPMQAGGYQGGYPPQQPYVMPDMGAAMVGSPSQYNEQYQMGYPPQAPEPSVGGNYAPIYPHVTGNPSNEGSYSAQHLKMRSQRPGDAMPAPEIQYGVYPEQQAPQMPWQQSGQQPQEIMPMADIMPTMPYGQPQTMPGMPSMNDSYSATGSSDPYNKRRRPVENF